LPTYPAAEQDDVIVIGGGPGGYVAAIKAGQLGLKVRFRTFFPPRSTVPISRNEPAADFIL
jgi:succinate dehydrogenase/fumarate reductase flavoprotein subunit